MRSIILLCFLILIPQLQTVFAQSKVQVTGKVTDIEISHEEKRVKVSYVVELTLTNRNEIPILLLDSGSPLLCISRELHGISSGDQKEKRLLLVATLPSSSRGAKEWEELETNLRSKKLPSNFIRSIGLNENISFRINDWFYISKEKNEYDIYQNALWDEVKNAKLLSLKLEYRVWPLDLENNSAENEPRPFGKKLRERWKTNGYLLLDDIVSEPVPISLNSVKVKTVL